jgi:hypothetical protein
VPRVEDDDHGANQRDHVADGADIVAHGVLPGACTRTGGQRVDACERRARGHGKRLRHTVRR